MGKQDEENLWKSAGPYLTLGWQMAITIVAGIYLGVYLDGRFNTKPAFTAAFALTFSAIALFNFVRTANNLGKNKDKSEK
jgi:F0F1-type ATP synthase assembly protein I